MGILTPEHPGAILPGMPGAPASTFPRLAAWTLGVAFAALGLWIVWLASPRVPYADVWRFLATWLELPFPANALAADNGHREVLPNLLRIAELHGAAADQGLQIAVGAGLVCAFVVLCWRRLATADWLRAPVALVLASGVFWLGNGRKLAHGNEIVPLGLIAVWLLVGLCWLGPAPADGSRVLAGPLGVGPRRVAAAALCGLLATLSFGSGAACFLAFAVVLWVLRAPLRDHLPLWLGAALAVLLLLFGGGGAKAEVALAPLAQADLWLRWFGAPFVWMLSPLLDPAHAARQPVAWLREPLLAAAEPLQVAFGSPYAARWPAVLFGGLGAVWLLVQTHGLRRRSGGSPGERIALGLGWFGFAVGALVVAVRVDYFARLPVQLTSQRYLPWSMLGWTGLVLGFLLRPTRRERGALATAFAMALLLLPSTVWTGRNVFRQLRAAEWTALGAAVAVLDRDLGLVETEAQDLERAVPLLAQHRTSVFAWPETQWLGEVPPAGALQELPARATRVDPVGNRFPGPGCRVWGEGPVPAGRRLLLLDQAGVVRGLAWRAPFDTVWSGWVRGQPSAAELRVAVRR
ncbi:MAG: hypothetical protein JNK49_17940 [Planctomycetes bacterium]|nr:hypothetical protein [Planctomycetota bacterium]